MPGSTHARAYLGRAYLGHAYLGRAWEVLGTNASAPHGQG